MGSKKFIQVFMVLAVTAGVLLTASCRKSGEAEKSPAGQKTAETQSETVAPRANVDIVYYFMTTQRCANCMKIEAYSKEAVEMGFADALKRGSMVWRIVNVDQPANQHFIKDYELYTKSVVLVKMRDGKQAAWKNLDRVWELLNDQAAFQKYVTDEVKQFVEKG
jgi:protein involved in sex pheromone biosynthesis